MCRTNCIIRTYFLCYNSVFIPLAWRLIILSLLKIKIEVSAEEVNGEMETTALDVLHEAACAVDPNRPSSSTNSTLAGSEGYQSPPLSLPLPPAAAGTRQQRRLAVVNRKYRYSQQTLLHLACRRQNWRMAVALLRLGADVNILDNVRRRILRYSGPD